MGITGKRDELDKNVVESCCTNALVYRAIYYLRFKLLLIIISNNKYCSLFCIGIILKLFP